MSDHNRDTHITVETDTLPVACSLGNQELAARSAVVRRELLAGVEERQALDRGYAFRFAGNGNWSTKIHDFVTTERQCCLFLRIDVSFEPGLGPIWLTLTGPAGTKQFIEETFLASQA